MTGCDTAVVGAGPYGLCVAAHLQHAGADFRTFARTFDKWRIAMPKGMYLKSDEFASNLSAPESARQNASADPVVALFPQELMRDPSSRYVSVAHHDVPEHAPDLVAHVSKSLRKR